MWTLTPRRTCDSERAVIDSLNTCCDPVKVPSQAVTLLRIFVIKWSVVECPRGPFSPSPQRSDPTGLWEQREIYHQKSFVLLVIFDTTYFHNWPYNLNWFISDIYDIYIIYKVIYINQYFAMKLDSMCSAQGAGCGKVLKEFALIILDHPGFFLYFPPQPLTF